MSQLESSIFTDLGVAPVINAAGPRTVMGGSRLSPAVAEAYQAANRHFVVMKDLQARSGEHLAQMLGSEMALVTSGCAAALSLAVAGIMSGTDRARIAQLPATTGMKDEIVIQACQRYSYDRALTLCGARLVEAGSPDGVTEAELEAAITDRTAAVHYLGVDFWGVQEHSLPFETLRDVAHAHGLPLIVDAASVVFPLERMTWFSENGADIVCFGAKYFGAFNGSGILTGKRKYMEAAIEHSFVNFETEQNRAFGRPFKLDRQEIVGVVAALNEWFEMDHEERMAQNEEKGRVLRRTVANCPGVTSRWETRLTSIMDTVRLELDEDAAMSARELSEALANGNPSIAALASGNSLEVVVNQLYEGETEIVGARLKELLGG